MVGDTSKDYDDLVGYKAPKTVKADLTDILGLGEDEKPSIRPKPVDPDFPEEWQNLHVNFNNFEDYAAFMKLIGEVPLPRLNTLVYKKDKDNGLLDFFGD